MGETHDHDIITLEQTRDPQTGEVVFAAPGDVLRMTEDGIVHGQASALPVTLPTDRFAGEDEQRIDWHESERQQSAGLVVSMVDGKLVTGAGPESQSVALPSNRFAAPADPRFRAENEAVLALSGAGASGLVKLLKHSSRFASWPATSPAGWVYTTKPTPSHGDQLTTLVAFNYSTGLYHAHFWRFDVLSGGRRGAVDLPSYLHRHPNLTAHGTHMYPDDHGGAILCLSTHTRGGLRTLPDVVFQAAKWAAGMGEVVRGRRFPYAE